MEVREAEGRIAKRSARELGHAPRQSKLDLKIGAQALCAGLTVGGHGRFLAQAADLVVRARGWRSTK
jgi:hypothetical protein